MASAFERFSRLLATGDYDAGVLGGDLLDEWLPDGELVSLLSLGHDDLIDDLPGEGEDPVEAWKRSDAFKRQNEGLAIKVRIFEEILDAARRPVLLVLGNHDRSPWPDTEHITNIHMRRVEIGGRAFVGYRWTSMERRPDEIGADMVELAQLVDRRSILVSHSPPWGILDGERSWKAHHGLRELRAMRPKPWLNLVGHVHGLAGRSGRCVNGSWPMVRKFFEIEVDRRRVRMVE